MPNKLVLAGICLLAAGLETVGARSPISLDVLRRDGYGSVYLVKTDGNQLYVPVEIDGKKFKLALDSGFGGDGFAIGGAASDLHLTPTKNLKSAFVQTMPGTRRLIQPQMVQSVVIGNVQIHDVPVYAFEGFGASLGCGFLHVNNAVLDLANLTLYLRPPRTGKPVDLSHALTALGMEEAPLSVGDGGVCVVSVEVNNVPTKLLLHTGAQVTVLDDRFADQAKLRGWGRKNQEWIDVTGFHKTIDFAGPRSFKIGGVPLRTSTLTLTTLPMYSETGGRIAGVLGLDILGSNRSVIDFGQNKLYFAKAK